MANRKITGEATAITWRDALSVAYTSDRMWVITSPNMKFVPAPPVGVVDVILRADYRYGIVDPTQWPQIYSPGHEYLCAIPRYVAPPHRLSPLWWTPHEQTDFEHIEGCTLKCLGLLRQDSIRSLCELLDEMSALVADVRAKSRQHVDERLIRLETVMRHSRERLQTFPCTFRDAAMQVREAQRYWLMCRAFLDYYGTHMRPRDQHRPVNTALMGAFTTDPGVVQTLYEAGIPVWWIRQDASILEDIVVVAIEELLEPHDICTRFGATHGDVLYRGLVGPGHLAAMARGGHTYMDISRAPLLVVDVVGGYAPALSHREYQNALKSPHGQVIHADTSTPSGPSRTPGSGPSRGSGPASVGSRGHPYERPTKKQASHGRGIDKFADITHPWMPIALGTWREVMQNVKQVPRANPWGYWIPDPGMFVRTQTEERAVRYFMTWLRLRPGWLYMLRVRDAALSRISPQWWRDFLYGDTGRSDQDRETRNAIRARQFMLVFGKAFQREDLDLDPTAPPSWFGRKLRTLDKALCPQIVWEICELGFRYELLALDRLLVPLRNATQSEEWREDLIGRVFPDGSLYGVTALPEEGREGLSAQVPHRRAPYLEAFRVVLARWPRCPPSIHSGVPITTALTAEMIVARERELVQYYVETFYDESGRAPIVPRVFPRP
ncbi:hypothetical protein OH77DRAFT_1518275 [Trametes cingulata]|nr:hypothetical protein OH77DRAFT_1518275 [Trametes cingulata]